ncbi:BQ5605_C016g08225 [Microbotryum silenes-dioicae]|uniref:BQ5605_C016g08225 protein n=1 Tax=Microbotryum silenes-dioicae TaxID=796604 RepID=A0A2X0LVK0_9BASI|nr:BQ5605_C016g08225 [Microbotryum silenes-dioicae]
MVPFPFQCLRWHTREGFGSLWNVGLPLFWVDAWTALCHALELSMVWSEGRSRGGAHFLFVFPLEFF